MSDDTIGDTHVTVTLGSEEVRLRKLTVYDRRNILKGLRGEQRKLKIETLKDVGADKAEMLGELEAFDEKPLEDFDFLRHFDTPDGKADVFDAALDEYSEAEQKRLRGKLTLSLTETTRLAARLCNIPLQSAAESEGGDPNAGSPATATDPDSYNSPTT
jgi:hypothetical protein